jgi:HTH-type transcriptional regulator, competence development regulator
MLGEKIRALREANGLLQRHIAIKLDVDIAYVSKMEQGEKPVSRNYLEKLSKLFEVPEEELQTLWVADKLYAIAKDEEVALQAMEVVQDELKHHYSTKK